MDLSRAPADSNAVDRLMDATLLSIHRHGFGRTTVTSVTDIAGLSRGMVRHEFGSKQQMVVAAMTRLCDRWLSATDPDASSTGDEQVRSIVRAMFAPEAFNLVNVDAWIALSVEAGSDPELRAVRERTQRRWTEQLTAAFRASGVIEPEQAAAAMLAAADGLWLQQRVAADPIGHDAAAATVLRVADALLSGPRQQVDDGLT